MKAGHVFQINNENSCFIITRVSINVGPLVEVNHRTKIEKA